MRRWEDKDIIALYWERSERAIEETDIKYGKLCRSLSMGIVDDRRDSEEVINDSWLAVVEHTAAAVARSFSKRMCAGSLKIFP